MVGPITLHRGPARPSHWSCRAYTHYSRPLGGRRRYSSMSISARTYGLRFRFAFCRRVARANAVAPCFTRRVERVSTTATQTSRSQLLEVAVVDDLRCFIRLDGH